MHLIDSHMSSSSGKIDIEILQLLGILNYSAKACGRIVMSKLEVLIDPQRGAEHVAR